jgi:hypothetical protein
MKITTLALDFHGMKRHYYLDKIELMFEVNRVVALLGPRQSGKTTIAQQYCESLDYFPAINYFDLENPEDLARLENPKLALQNLEGTIIIDEIQRKPDLFNILRYIHDTHSQVKFLLLGSASRELVNCSSETLAGRISYIEVTPFSLHEMVTVDNNLWYRGGYPRSFLASSDKVSKLWLRDYVRTYAEQDMRNLGINVNPELIKRFWMMLSHYHGQIFNASELGNSLGLSAPTIKNYLDILHATFMVRILKPYHVNIAKRQVKSPKIYLRDSGIFHHFLNLHNYNDILAHPKLGASWEGFALEQVIRYLDAENESYFWATHNHAELDLLIIKDGKRLGFEFKYQDAPKLTPSMRIALKELDLDQLFVIYPGEKSYLLQDNIQVINLEDWMVGKERHP